MTSLSVNVDHVATVRQARGVSYPDPVAAAKLALDAGAGGITIHLRSDRRHIQDQDLARLVAVPNLKLNLEIAVADEMLAIALEQRPRQVTLVPEKPDEITTEGGLDLESQFSKVESACNRLQDCGIDVSVFLDPNSSRIAQLQELKVASMPAIELNTDSYSRASKPQTQKYLDHLVEAAKAGSTLGCRLFAGHGLTVQNVGAVSALPEIEELNIGHSIIARSVLVGMTQAVGEILDAMQPH
ncbi:MAG: pyridoxine 5'-phosphate synthase [Thermoanaerobaculia bacterium]